MLKKLELINPASDRWVVRWDFTKDSNDLIDFALKIFIHKPTQQMIKKTIEDYYNTKCRNSIKSSLIWNDLNIILDEETLRNISLVIPSYLNGDNQLPLILKVGSETYHTFTSISELLDFYKSVSKHIADCLKECWESKLKINLEEYKL